jgi:hypothetical protein
MALEHPGRGRNIMNEIISSSEPSTTILERTVHTSISIPNWATADQVAEAMEILDPSLEPTGWHGVHPGWGATTIYEPPKSA